MNRKDRRSHRPGARGGPPVPGDAAQENALIQRLVVRAAEPANHGQAWGRGEARVRGEDGRVRVVHRTFHVDLNAMTLTTTVAWDGVESSRTTEKLPKLESLQKPGIFAPKPRAPGPPRPVRLPLNGLQSHDADAVMRSVIQSAEDEITATGALYDRLILVFDDHMEELRLDDARAAAPQGSALATLTALEGRPGVNFRILAGELAAAGPNRCGFVVALADGDPDARFQLAKRRFQVLGGRMASWAEWEVADAHGWDGTWDELPGRISREGKPWAWGAATPVPLPEISGALGAFTPGARRPATAAEFADAAAGILEEEAWTRGLDGVRVFAFRGAEIEQFVVRGEIPFGLDDLCRAVAARGDVPDALAVMRLGIFRDEEAQTQHRAVLTTAEAGGVRYQRALVMRWKPAAKPDDPAANVQVYGSALMDVAGVEWIGVPPVTDVIVFPETDAEA